MAEALPGPVAEVVEEAPFAAVRRWSAVTLAGPEPAAGTYVLGAVQALAPALPAYALAPESRLAALAGGHTAHGLRVLAFARAVSGPTPLRDPTDQLILPDLELLGLVVLADELRPHVRETLADLHERGVAVKVVSGDDPRTVAALVAQLGLTDDSPVSGAELAELEPDRFDEVVGERSVFGRIAPEQKEQIVESLINAGRYVAMIGDGVNDVRSLKRAHVGIAMQSGSSVARDVADLVLLNDSFAALPLATEEGQRIIGGLTVSLKLFLSRVAVSMVCIIGIGILGLRFPYEPAQVALTLFTVGLPSVFLTFWARPQRPDRHVVAELVRFVVPVAVVTGVFAIGLYTALATLLTNGLQNGMLPSGAVAQFETFTGLSRTDPTFVEATATVVAQTGLSMFTAVTAFVLVVFLEPPIQFFTGWAEVSPDKRPAVLAAGLLAAFAAVLAIPQTAAYFDLVQPGGFMIPFVAMTTVVWFFGLRATWRHHLLQRSLGLPTDAEPSE